LDLVQRAKAVLFSPAAEWRAIEPESGDAGYLFANYAAILAAIPPFCEFLRGGVFGWGGPSLRRLHHVGFFSSLFGAAVQYLVALVLIYAMAVIIDGLAPTFSGQKSQQNALKLSVYSLTPAGGHRMRHRAVLRRLRDRRACALARAIGNGGHRRRAPNECANGVANGGRIRW